MTHWHDWLTWHDVMTDWHEYVKCLEKISFGFVVQMEISFVKPKKLRIKNVKEVGAGQIKIGFVGVDR